MQADEAYLTLQALENNVISVMIIADNAQGNFVESVTRVRTCACFMASCQPMYKLS